MGSNTRSDQLNVAGTLTCKGNFKHLLFFQEHWWKETVIKIFSAKSIAGTFDAISLPELESDLEWDISQLYTEGIISVVKSTGTTFTGLEQSFVGQPNYRNLPCCG